MKGGYLSMTQGCTPDRIDAIINIKALLYWPFLFAQWTSFTFYNRSMASGPYRV